ncbi:lactonase family protein [Streptomyces sp. NPDC048182]|uniref:lactonase family protein n=1 Tax=Streptomyces sp. NPDC048182 TaxID=3365507 RepID=UPI0037119155
MAQQDQEAAAARRPSRRLFLSATAGAAVPLALTGPARASAPRPAPRATRPLYIGTYTSSGGPGIDIAAHDPATGALTRTSALSLADPSFLAASGSGLLYAVNEYRDSVTALTVPGGPRVLNSANTGGSGPCHLVVHATGGHLLTANYGSGSVAVHALAADGRLGARTDLVQHTGSGPDPDRQRGPHAHMVLNDPAGAFVLAVDLGTDTLYTYRLDTRTGRLAAVSQARTRPGAGPRHAVFHPSGRYLYTADELGDSLTVCRYDPGTGRVTPGAVLPTVAAGSGGTTRNYPAEIVLSPDAAHLYVSNRGHDSIARFALDQDAGRPTLLDTVPAGGSTPRHIALAPGGDWLFAANQTSGTVTVFARDRTSGRLTPTGPPYPVKAAACVLPA